jgi:LysR family transcriptional regulator, transcriptional activator for dmlA
MIAFELLRMFVAVAEEGSIAAAARRENLAPSIASRKLAALERELGAVLFLRTTRRLRLTEAGRSSLGWARETLAGYARVRDEIGALQDRPAGLVRIACNEYLGDHYLVDALQHFRRTYPDIRFVVTTSDRPGRLLEQGYDIALHGGPLPEINAVGRRVRSYRRVLCATPRYLAGRDVPRTPADLQKHSIIAHSRNEPRNWFFRRDDGPTMAQPLRATIEVNSYTLLFQLVLKGLGVARVTEGAVKPFLKKGELIELLARHRSVNPDGSDPAIWLLQPSRDLPHAARLCAEHLITHMQKRAAQFHGKSS